MQRYVAVPSEQQVPPRPRSRSGGVADEGAVDVDEPRDTPTREGSTPAPTAAAARLSPVQSAYGRYAAHFLGCDRCRSIDETCEEAGPLWRAFQEAGEDARRKLAGG